MTRRDLIECCVVATDVFYTIVNQNRLQVELTDMSDLIDEKLEQYELELLMKEKMMDEQGKELLVNSFTRHFFEREFVKLLRLESSHKIMYEEIEIA